MNSPSEITHWNIIVISPEYWGKSFVSKHHYANYLSNQHKVIFLEPSHGWNIRNLFVRDWELKQENENLWVASFSHSLPSITKLPKFIQRILFKNHAHSLMRFLKKNLNFSIDLVWSFDPHRFWDLNVFKPAKLIYHSVDFHPGARFEKEAISSADLFLGIANLIDNSLKSFAKKYIKIGHGADINGFNKKLIKNLTLPGDNKIKAGYIGNFHRQLDYNLLKSLVVENPDVDFILIGPTKPNNLASVNIIEQAIFNELNKEGNVFFVGEIESDLLMSYMHHFDINLVFFKKEFETIHCNPHKLMGYFYSGKVLLSTYIDEYKHTSPDLITMTNTPLEFLNTFNKTKKTLSENNSDTLALIRKNFALENSYNHKINFILDTLNNKV